MLHYRVYYTFRMTIRCITKICGDIRVEFTWLELTQTHINRITDPSSCEIEITHTAIQQQPSHPSTFNTYWKVIVECHCIYYRTYGIFMVTIRCIIKIYGDTRVECTWLELAQTHIDWFTDPSRCEIEIAHTAIQQQQPVTSEHIQYISRGHCRMSYCLLSCILYI